MKENTLHINKPSKALLSFLDKLKEDKRKTKEDLRNNKHLYFK
ncbi:hypothetical protein HYO65_gp103 [Tenacibaculum phage PTm1]|uniref:Uncharacterized protein n=2 Tax=Shirahamavirus PTm1 TaxID=2846435 RepID=A0A5S9HX78_9CAUD|nr:hypothetical protein HYO65_gp103 [Tenacibaculum phage PTm1]BBI90495.1 hypothetical protein [Tenacibaculum phage PTm1]BBI90803.1 hypothetical protein [Tenacibaculum phage PTm5]